MSVLQDKTSLLLVLPPGSYQAIFYYVVYQPGGGVVTTLSGICYKAPHAYDFGTSG